MRSSELHEHVLGAAPSEKDKPAKKPNPKRNPLGYWKAVLQNILTVPKDDKETDDPRMWTQSALDYLKHGSVNEKVAQFAKAALLYRALEAGTRMARKAVVPDVAEMVGLKKPGFGTRLGRAAKNIALAPVKLPAKAVGAAVKGGAKMVGGKLLSAVRNNPVGAFKAMQVAKEFARRGGESLAETRKGFRPRRPLQ